MKLHVTEHIITPSPWRSTEKKVTLSHGESITGRYFKSVETCHNPKCLWCDSLIAHTIGPIEE